MNIQILNKCVINLPSRTDRLESVKKELSYLFEDNSFNLIDGVENRVPMLGIAEAHLNCIRLAKNNNWSEVLIIEDDVRFQAKEKTLKFVNEAFNHLPDNWDILLGGLYEADGLTPHNNFWNRTKEFCGAHFYIVNSKCYDEILKYEGRFHIDRFINLGGNKLNCFVTNKFFAIQYDGFSDNVKMKTDYADKLVRFELLK